MDSEQAVMLVLEAVLVAAVFLLLFRLRVWLGLSLLFVAIGVMQPIQVHLSTYMYVEVLPGLRMSPGSVVLFPASLFAVLLVYIREDAVAVRKVIYGLVAANLLVSALYLLLDLHAGMASTSLVGDAAGAMYVTGARSMAAGTAALLVDVVALIVVYEWIGRGTRRSLFLRTFLTLAVVLAIDSVIFATAAFAGTDLFGDVLVAGLVGKSVAALLFSMAMVAYLRLFEREAWSPELAGERPIRDVFHALTYREKYEAHRTVAARAQAKADEHRIALLHATKDGILTVDQHLTIEDASRSAEATFCVAPEAMVGRALGAFLGSEALFDAIRHQVAPDGPLEAVGLRGGQEFPVEVVVVPLHERRDGGAVLSVRDLTERRRAELARAEESMTNVVGQLAGGVAHDFNNLLTVVLGSASMLQLQAERDGREQPELQAIIDAATGAGELTRQLLLFAKKQVLDPRLIDVNERIRRLHGMLRSLVGGEFVVELRLKDQLPPVVCSPTLLDQVVINLVCNARDASSPGSRIRVCTAMATGDVPARGLRPGRYLEISVEDDGCGITADVLAQIFHPYFTTKEPERGTGLGLAVSKGFVEQSGGAMAVESVPGVGSTFSVFLPQAKARSGVAQESARSVVSRLIGRILVVDDADQIRSMIGKMLRAEGHEVTTAASGEEALAVAEGAEVDVLLTDLAMPGMHGGELAAQLRQRSPRARIVFMSGNARSLDPSQLLDLPGPVLQKPFTREQLLAALRASGDRSGNSPV